MIFWSGDANTPRSEIICGVPTCSHCSSSFIRSVIHMDVDLNPPGSDVCVGSLPVSVSICLIVLGSGGHVEFSNEVLQHGGSSGSRAKIKRI